MSYKKEGIPKIRRDFLGHFSKELAKYIKESKESVIVIHGGGSITHPLVDFYNIEVPLKKGIICKPRERDAALRIHLAMNQLNKKVVQSLLKKGISAWPIQTSAIAISKDRRGHIFNFDAVRVALANGFVPILHGDFIFDSKTGISICSGDMIACALAGHFKANKLLIASDVDGVYSEDPFIKKDAYLFDSLAKEDIMVKVKRGISIDHSGDMSGKLDCIMKYCKGVHTIIFNGIEKGSFRKIFKGEKLGTKIIIR